MSPNKLVAHHQALTILILKTSEAARQVPRFKLKRCSQLATASEAQRIRTNSKQIFLTWIKKIMNLPKSSNRARLTYVYIQLMLVNADEFSTNKYSFSNNYVELKKPNQSSS
jgi:hypothetical protein